MVEVTDVSLLAGEMGTFGGTGVEIVFPLEFVEPFLDVGVASRKQESKSFECFQDEIPRDDRTVPCQLKPSGRHLGG